MNNYEYIIASLPAISRDWVPAEGVTATDIIGWIKGQCSAKDIRLIDLLTDGFVGENLDESFYRKAADSSNRFIREYFSFDLLVRNSKVKYLNEALGRPAGTDIFMEAVSGDPDADNVQAVFRLDDILGRERAIDGLMWRRITEITTFDNFDIEAILGFIAKLHIVSRWLELNEESGREMFASLLGEVRGSYEGVSYAG